MEHNKNKDNLVLAFSSDVYNLDDLGELNAYDLYNLAVTDKSTGGDTAELCTISEFGSLFNSGCVDPSHTYIFFINL